VPPLLTTFGLVPEVELGVMNPGQSLSSLMARLLDALDPVLDALRFDWVVVQGDTTTALAAALAAYHRHVPVAHVEAGLRTHDLEAPFPEEGNRQLIARLASLHLAPTPRARTRCSRGRGGGPIEVTGNTVVDAARQDGERLPADGAPPVGGAARAAALHGGAPAGADHRAPPRELRGRPGGGLRGPGRAGARLPGDGLRVSGAPQSQRAGGRAQPPRRGSPTCTCSSPSTTRRRSGCCAAACS
jgi:hypothetical protein